MPSGSKLSPSVNWLIVAALPLALVLGLGLGYRQELRSAWVRGRYPRIVLVSLDTLNVRYTGPYNPSVDATPNLDRLASEGVVFANAYTTVPMTLPAHASLMTGRGAEDLGVMLNGDSLADEAETLAELLRRAEYRTAAFISLGVVHSRFNLDQGFDHYDDEYFLRTFRWYRTADEVVEAARPWIRAAQARPFFIWLHLSDPHEPYVAKDAPPDTRLTRNGETVGEWTLRNKQRQTIRLQLAPGRHRLTWRSLRAARPDDLPDTALHLRLLDVESIRPWLVDPETDLTSNKVLRDTFTLEVENDSALPEELTLRFDGKIKSPPPSEVREQYAMEVAFVDRQLGELRRYIESLQPNRETLWILVSDHGEGLYRHQKLGHAEFVQEDQLRILWMLAGPRIERGSRVETPVLIQDVLPTVIELLGLETAPEVTGRPRTDCWRKGRCAGQDGWWAFGAAVESGTLTAMAGYRPPWKLLWEDRRARLFNLAEDPWETTELGRQVDLDSSGRPLPIAALRRELPERRMSLQQRLEQRPGAPTGSEHLEILESLGYLGN